MLKFYGNQPPDYLVHIEVGGYCPHCKTGTRFTETTVPISELLRSDDIEQVVISYACDICLGPIPIQWSINRWDSAGNLEVENPVMVLRSVEPFEFDFVPEKVAQEIREALNCLSVDSFNGFAALCRRAIQAISTDFGAAANDKVQNQVNNMLSTAGLGEEWKELVNQIIVSGHDGAHPHLPEMSADRAAVLLAMVRDLTYEIYTRPGRIKEAAMLRQKVIEKNR